MPVPVALADSVTSSTRPSAEVERESRRVQGILEPWTCLTRITAASDKSNNGKQRYVRAGINTAAPAPIFPDSRSVRARDAASNGYGCGLV